MEPVLAGSLYVVDILMPDVLRLVGHLDGLTDHPGAATAWRAS